MESKTQLNVIFWSRYVLEAFENIESHQGNFPSGITTVCGTYFATTSTNVTPIDVTEQLNEAERCSWTKEKGRGGYINFFARFFLFSLIIY